MVRSKDSCGELGESAMISGMCGVRGDVIPFGYAIGALAREVLQEVNTHHGGRVVTELLG